MPRTRVGWVSLLLGLVALVCVLWPSLGLARWLSQLPVLAHALAFPLLSGVLLAIGGVVARRVEWAAVGITLALLPQGWPTLADAPGAYTVLSYNTQDSLTRAELDGLVGVYEPDLLVLPEATLPQPPPGYAMVSASDLGGRIAPTVMLVHERLGDFREVSAPQVTWGAVAVELDDGTVLAGVHPSPPVPGSMEGWRSDLAVISDWALGHEKLVLAGDFNATLRHGPMASLDLVEGSWCGGTWPAPVPSWLASPIDHVLVSPSVGAGECATLRVGESDHRAVVARVG